MTKQKAAPEAKKQKVEATEPTASFNLFVGNLNFSKSAPELKTGISDLFAKNDLAVVDVRIGVSRTFGYVDFESAEDLEKALELTGLKVFGNEIKLEKPKGKDSKKDRDARTLLAKNLSYKVTQEELKEMFEDAVEIRLVSKDGKSKGIAYIEFKTEADAEKTLEEKQGTEIDGRSISLYYTGEKGQSQDYRGGKNSTWSGESKTLVLSNLSYSAMEETLQEVFEKATFIKVPQNQNGKSKGCIRAGARPARPSALAVAPSGLYSPFKPTFSTDLQNPIHNMVFPTNKKERGMKGGPLDSIEFDPEKDRLFEATLTDSQKSGDGVMVQADGCDEGCALLFTLRLIFKNQVLVLQNWKEANVIKSNKKSALKYQDVNFAQTDKAGGSNVRLGRRLWREPSLTRGLAGVRVTWVPMAGRGWTECPLSDSGDSIDQKDKVVRHCEHSMWTGSGVEGRKTVPVLSLEMSCQIRSQISQEYPSELQIIKSIASESDRSITHPELLPLLPGRHSNSDSHFF
eukprot:bmy_12013T0